MKKILKNSCLLFLFFSAGLLTAPLFSKASALFPHKNELSFPASSYPIQNRSFAVVILGKNNALHVEKTLRSVFEQNYDSFRVVYIDDASTDGSFSLAKDFIYGSKKSEKTLLLQNNFSLGEFQNLQQIVNLCDNQEILVVLQGEDLLSHEWVLQRLNQYYANPDLWIAFADSLETPSFTNPCTALKTFYAPLLKELGESYVINPEDLSYVEPLIELGKSHFQKIPEVLCLVRPHPEEKI